MHTTKLGVTIMSKKDKPGLKWNEFIQVKEVLAELGYILPQGVTEEAVKEFCETHRFRREMLKMWGVK